MTAPSDDQARSVASPLCRDPGGEACAECGSRIIGLSFAVNLFAPLVKGVVGVLCGSQALIADTVHSLSDTVAFGINYFGSRENRLSSFAQSVLVGSLTFLAGVWIYTENIAILIIGERARPGLLGPIVAGVSLLTNLYLYSISACAQRRCPDTATRLCMLQNRTNSYAAGLALIGMVLADFGFTLADPLCAVIIGTSLFTTAFEMFQQAFADQAQSARTTRRKRWVVFLVGGIACCLVASAVADVIGRNDVILVPAQGQSLDSPVDDLLGRAHDLLVVNTEDRTVVPIVNGYRHYQGDVSDQFLHVVQLREVDVVLAKRVGREMFGDLRGVGVRVYYIHDPITVAEALSRYRSGRYELATGPNVGRGFGRDHVHWLKPW